MKKNKSTKNSPNTEGGQIINNYAPIEKQINIQTMNVPILDIEKPENQLVTPSCNLIKQAIAQSETDKAFQLLTSLLKTQHKDKIDDAILIESRWQHLKKEKYRGVVDDEDYNIEQNRIHESLLVFVKQLRG